MNSIVVVQVSDTTGV